MRTSDAKTSGEVHFPHPSGALVIEIGLVMLQGSRQAHVKAIESAAEKAGANVNIREVRTPGDLLEPKLHAIILPGGESTTMRKVGGEAGTRVLGEIFKMLRERPDLPVLATCAGTILLADPQDEGPPIIQAAVDRNAWGRQIDSFLASVSILGEGEQTQCAFIRAPKFTEVPPGLTIASIEGETVGVRERNVIALTFHPELSRTTVFHEMLLEAVAANNDQVNA